MENKDIIIPEDFDPCEYCPVYFTGCLMPDLKEIEEILPKQACPMTKINFERENN